MDSLARWAEKINPDMAGSVREGMEETLTVIRLDVSPLLYKTVYSTNPIESLNSAFERFSHRVKRWRNGDMKKRWLAAAIIQAEERMHRVRDIRAACPPSFISISTNPDTPIIFLSSSSFFFHQRYVEIARCSRAQNSLMLKPLSFCRAHISFQNARFALRCSLRCMESLRMIIFRRECATYCSIFQGGKIGRLRSEKEKERNNPPFLSYTYNSNHIVLLCTMQLFTKLAVDHRLRRHIDSN